jgi:hypothetical protein
MNINNLYYKILILLVLLGVLYFIKFNKDTFSHINNSNLKIFYRYSDSKNMKNRPDYFSKQKCFESFVKKFKNHTIFVIADNVSNESYEYLSSYVGKDNVIRTSLHNSKSFIYTVKKAIEMFPDNEKIYLVEDDYIHTNDAPDILLEGLELADYVSGYDHSDKYINHNEGGPNPFIKDGGEETRVILSKNKHWKFTNSCCMTFATTVKVLREDCYIYEEFCKENIPDDFGMFTKLLGNGRTVISAIPAISTHCEIQWLSPIIDWEKVLLE